MCEWGGGTAVNVIVVFSLGAYYLDFPRAYLYGWFYALTVASTFWQMDRGLHIPIIGLILAGIMVGIGLVLFARFWRSHPIPKENPVKVKRGAEKSSREDFGVRQAGENTPACFGN